MQLSQLKWSGNSTAVLRDGGLQTVRYHPGLIFLRLAYGLLNAIAGQSGRENPGMPRALRNLVTAGLQAVHERVSLLSSK
jgi:hypothetical protein